MIAPPAKARSRADKNANFLPFRQLFLTGRRSLGDTHRIKQAGYRVRVEPEVTTTPCAAHPSSSINVSLLKFRNKC